MNVILGMPFLTFNNVEVLFTKRELIWQSYSLVEVLIITNQVQIIGQKKFAAIVLNPKKEAF